MLNRYFTALLAFTLVIYSPWPIHAEEGKVFTVEEVRKLYPNANIETVSPEKFQDLQKTYAQNSTPIGATPSRERPPTNREDPCNLAVEDSPSPPPDRYDSGPNFGGNWNISGGGDSGKALLVIVAVIGIVVVAGMVVYSLGYFASMGTRPHCRAWDELGYRLSYIQGNSLNSERIGRLNGIYYSTGFPSPIAVLGVTIEAGYHNLELNIQAKDLKSGLRETYYGSYLMAGPRFTFPIRSNPGTYFNIEWIGGTSSLSKIGLMSTMRFSYQFKIGQVGVDLGLGVAHIKIKETDGYLQELDHLTGLSGVSVGYRF